MLFLVTQVSLHDKISELRQDETLHAQDLSDGELALLAEDQLRHNDEWLVPDNNFFVQNLPTPAQVNQQQLDGLAAARQRRAELRAQQEQERLRRTEQLRHRVYGGGAADNGGNE